MFFAFTSQEGLIEPIDGIVGMARNSGLEGFTPGPIYVNEMYQAGLIDSYEFSFYSINHLNGAGLASYVDIGKNPSPPLKANTQSRTIRMVDHFFWVGMCQGMAFGDTTDDNSFSFLEGQAISTIFDTGTSHLLVPASYFSTIVDYVVTKAGNPQTEFYQGFVITECATTYQPVYLMFNELWIQLDPSDYVKDVSENGDKSVCMLLFMPFEQDIFLLGSPIFMDYYATHKDLLGTIDLQPHAQSYKLTLEDGPLPMNEMPLGSSSGGSSSTWLYIISALFLTGMSLFGILWLQPKLVDWYPGNEGMQYLWLSLYSMAIGLSYYYLILPWLTKLFSVGRRGKTDNGGVYAASAAYFGLATVVWLKIVKPMTMKKE